MINSTSRRMKRYGCPVHHCVIINCLFMFRSGSRPGSAGATPSKSTTSATSVTGKHYTNHKCDALGAKLFFYVQLSQPELVTYIQLYPVLIVLDCTKTRINSPQKRSNLRFRNRTGRQKLLMLNMFIHQVIFSVFHKTFSVQRFILDLNAKVVTHLIQ